MGPRTTSRPSFLRATGRRGAPTLPGWPFSLGVSGAWLATAALLLVTLGLTLQAQRRAAHAQSSWGETTVVWVAKGPLPAGQVIAPLDVESRPYPRAMVPPTAVTDTPVGRVARSSVQAGEMLLADRLAPPGTAWAELGVGMVGLALPTELAPPGVVPGDAVALIHPDGVVDGYLVQMAAGGDQLVVAIPLTQGTEVVAALLERRLLVASLSPHPRLKE